MTGRKAGVIGFLFLLVLGTSFLIGGEMPPAPTPLPTPKPVLSLTEIDDDAETRSLARGLPVDINSSVRISIDKGVLQTRLGSPGPSPPLADKIAQAKSLLRASELSVENVTKPFLEFATRDSPPLPSAYTTLVNSLLGPTLVFNRSPVESTSVQAIVSNPLPGPSGVAAKWVAVMEPIVARATALRATRAGLAESDDSVQVFMVGAWLVSTTGSRQLHIPGFDSYPESPEQLVDRFVIVLNEQQQKELVNLTKQAHDANNDPAGPIAAYFRRLPSQMLAVVLGRQACVTDLANAINALAEDTDPEVIKAKNGIAASVLELQSYVGFLSLLATRYSPENSTSTTSADVFLVSVLDDLNSLIARTKKALSAANSLRQTVQGLLDGGKLGATAKKLAGAVQERVVKCVAEAFNGTDVEALLSSLQVTIKARQTNAGVAAWGDGSLQFTLDRLPSEGTVVLPRGGSRQAGDVLLIKIAASPQTKPFPPRDLEVHEFEILRRLSHIDTVVGMIFAHPASGTAVRAYFQAAPSYSVLFKLPCEGKTCRKWIDFGVGLNLSALDFKHEDKPELGVGVVFSCFRDYLQVGSGYNVPESKFYWFFGLRLPLPTFTLPAATQATDAK